ncbi:hypothetical protein BDQ12DRAFT_187417 [Crucibulum laeve]|uniref:Uncharacterized protein n=1 Tax=Crucibulum laeve TaxID=68775 RepID=A0A5C3MGV5_9AGAR|nr:hypothetical protein BDQ12DRAFT_187417 [Crucibulum laeve]
MVAEQDDLLSILNFHGQQFLQSFSLPSAEPSCNKRKRANESLASRKSPKLEQEDEGEDDEWGGITSEENGSENVSEQGIDEDSEQLDDDFRGETNVVADNVVVFSETRPQNSIADPATKAQMKAFMSSKVSKVRMEHPDAQMPVKSEADLEDEKTNAQNDAILHKLVHTKLLSGSLDSELDLTPAQRRKALAGRVLELTGGARLGKGEKSVREAERNKAAKRVREGIADKQRERDKQELEEAKNLGNYHPTLKKLYDASTSSSGPKRRDRGLKMGVGKFSGGLLHLSREEIGIAEGTWRGGSSRGSRGRGGRGSRSRGRGHGRGSSK